MNRYLREHTEVVALGGLLVVVVAMTGILPPGVYGLGIVAGAGLALQVIGLVLVYKANRVINFAQLQMAALAGTLFVELTSRRWFLSGLRSVCPSCLPHPTTVGDVVRHGKTAAALVASVARTGDLSQPLPQSVDRTRLAVSLAPSWMV